MDAETAELFPDGFEDSELGEIPGGWKVSSLGELFPQEDCVLTGPFGSNLHSSDYRSQGVPLILVKHVNNGKILEEDLPLVGEHKSAELSRYRLKEKDIVFTRVGAVGRSAYVYPQHEGWLISGQMLRVRLPNDETLHPRYLAQIYLLPSFIGMVENYALGTTRPSLNTSLLKSFTFLLPPIRIQNNFVRFANNLDNKIQQNLAENQTLTAIRDALLPKLLSGQIRVRDAEKMVESAV
jgi:type I restriction enzyme S subunit